MSRALSFNFLQAAYGQETSEVIVGLFTFTHATLAQPILLSTNPSQRISDSPLLYATNSRGSQYLFLPLGFSLPDDKSDTPPLVTLTLDNVDQDLVSILRGITSPLTVKLEIVLASTPDTVEVSFPSFEMTDIAVTEGQITGTLAIDARVNEPYPSGQFTPGGFPGVFA